MIKKFSQWLTENHIEDAIQFGIEKHQGQMRKYGGKPYFTHPSAVANVIKQFTNDQDVIIAAYLHDTLEDTQTTYQEIVEKFNERVANIVKELTSVKEDVAQLGKAQYLLNKMLHMSDEALLIKLADRFDNTSGFENDRQSLQGDPKLDKLNSFIEKYKKETHFILDGLKVGRKLNAQQTELFNRIAKNVEYNMNPS
jgi:(p)ppGpp synthase/HD superfamily hydrolase